MAIQRYVKFQTLLQTAVSPQTRFGVQLHLSADDANIPPDLRFRTSTKSSFGTDLTDQTAESYKATSVFYQQALEADEILNARWFKTATSPYFVCGTYEQDAVVWENVTDGAFTVVDSGANEDDLTGIDFTGVTTTAQWIAVLNAGLAALVGPSILGLDTAEFKLDPAGRLILEMPTTGDSAPTISIVAGVGVGTDLADAAYFDAANGFAASGHDAETPVEAITEIRQLTGGDSWWILCDSGLNQSEQEAMATYIESTEKYYLAVTNSVDAYNSALSTDLQSVLKALSRKRTGVIFHATATAYPDFAVNGRILPESEGTASWGFTPLAGVTESGGATKLTESQASVLKSKGYNFIDTDGSNQFLTPGRSASGEEIRLVLGVDWFDARVRSDWFSDTLNNKADLFDNATLARKETIVRNWLAQAGARNIIFDDYVVAFPDEDDITSAMRASRKFSWSDLFTAQVKTQVDEWDVIGVFQIGPVTQ